MFMKVEKKIEQIMEKKPSHIKTDNRIRRQMGLWLLVNMWLRRKIKG